MIDPNGPDVPDVGVDVALGPPRLVALSPESLRPSNKTWYQFQNPRIWKLRDGRLVIQVWSGRDQGPLPPMLHPSRQHYYVSSDQGKTWQFIETDQVQARAFVMERRTLADGRQFYFEPRHIEESKLGDTRVSGSHYRVGDLPERCQCVDMYTRDAREEIWTEGKAWLPSDLLVPIRSWPSLSLWRGISISYAFDVLHMQNPIHVLPNGALVVVAEGNYFDALDEKGSQVHYPGYLLRSIDGGHHWTLQGHVPGPSGVRAIKAKVTIMAKGNWVAMLRTLNAEGGTPFAALYVTRSYDLGMIWTEPEAIRPASVEPEGAVLENGIAFCKYGRPGHYLTFCADGEGQAWGNDVVLIAPPEEYKHEVTCNNNGVLITGSDRFLIVYSDFRYRDDASRLRKAIFVREVIARPKPPLPE